MHYVNNPPPAEALLMSARSFGNYDLPAALADLIDNSIKAKATLVEISFEFRAGDPMVRVTDNGVGMTETELVAAMRPASSDPEKERAVDDLGRFGWGLKSASFSQCKRLTVITRAENSDFCGASWNLDDCANYRMSILGSDDCSALGLPALKDGKGTHVIWENCDRLSENGELSLNAFDSAASDVCDRLSLIFQRFLDGTARHHKKLQIVVNGNQLEPFDPFMRSHSATTAMEIESLNIAGEQVVFRPYVLPHFSKLTPLESERLGGNSGYVRNQGFYVYRNDRLIIHGTWFDLVKYGELSQLVRISLDISSSLDSWWKISVDKSEAKLPSSLKGRILALVKPLRNRSKRVYRSRGGKLDRFNSGSVWSRYVRNGEVRYRVNRDHPIVATILKQDDIGEMAELLSLIEQQFPVGAFSQDALSRPDDISQVAIKPEQIDGQLNLLAPRLLAELDGDMNLLETTLLEIEPFINFPGIVDRWVEGKRMEIADRYEAEIAYCMSKLGKSGAVVGKSAISDVVEDAPFKWPENDKVLVKRLLESRYSIKQTRGVALVSNKHKPWLEAAKSTTDFWYWDRYQQYLLKDPDDGLPPNVVATLDRDTDTVLDLIGNPSLPGPWKFRGMVMGHVQMGKTTNYSALINKAADTGYKVIIVLAGITKTLRQQTQERLDEVFIGKESTFGGAFGDRPYPVTQYRSTPQHRWPVYGTQVQQDFTKPNARANGVSVSSLNEPIIFVLKKNVSVLENLADWFDEEIALTDRVDFPMLLIDDEADNASVNTAKDPKKITRINEGIRALLSRFSRSSYVAYTATPFANIFIDPDTEDDVLEHDLFPADFIYALSPPSNYVGASRIFSELGDLRKVMLREITDYPDVLPLDHKRDYDVVCLPKSLEEAIRIFAFALTIKSQRGLGHKHSTMMINVSRFNDVQESIAGAVYVYWDTLRRWVRMHGKNPKGGEGVLLDDLTATFNREFSNSTSTPLEEIFSEMWEAIRAVEIKTVNMRGGGLPYKEYEKNGEAYRVIAIGGLALSRGLTLEGLLVSYMLRNAAASDTLMQMARWFGYRPKYEDICRVFLPPQSIGHYEYVEEAIEELRSEINIMIARRQQPRHYGLKVRRSDTGIRITAANKMRTAERREIAADFSTKHVEGWAAYVRGEAAEANKSAVEFFIECLGKRDSATNSTDLDIAKDLKAHFCWVGVDAVQINKLLNDFTFPSVIASLAPISDTSSLFSDFVRPRFQSELSSWDVIIPQKVNHGEIKNLLGLDIKCRSRGEANLEAEGRSDKFIRFYGSKQRVADTNDASLLLSAEQRARARAKKLPGARFPSMQTLFCGERERPLLIIHAVDVVVEGALEQALTLSFCMPETAIKVAARSYEVNKIFMNQLALDFESDLDDDANAEE